MLVSHALGRKAEVCVRKGSRGMVPEGKEKLMVNFRMVEDGRERSK